MHENYVSHVVDFLFSSPLLDGCQPANGPLTKMKNKVLQIYSAPGCAFQKTDASESSDDDSLLASELKQSEMKQSKRRKAPVPTCSPPNINLLRKSGSTSLYSPTRPLANVRSSPCPPSNLLSPERVASPSSIDQRTSCSGVSSTRSADSELSSQSGDGITYRLIVPPINVPQTHNYTDL